MSKRKPSHLAESVVYGHVPPSRRDRKRWFPGEASEIYALFKGGLSTYEIARRLVMHESEIVRAIDAHRGYVDTFADVA